MPRMPRLYLTVLLLGLVLLARPAVAHFPFIVADERQTQASLVLSESLAIDTDVTTERLAAGTKLSLRDAAGKNAPLTLGAGDHAMTFALSGSGTRVIHGASDFGVRQRGEGPAYLLVYYPKAILGDPFDPRIVVGGDVPVELVPARADGGIRFQLLIGGKPAPEREVKIIHPDGAQSTQKTDAQGLTEKL